MSALAGIFTPNIVPLDRDGDINEAELRRYVDWLIERGVHGLYPNGSTGEFTRFTAEERRRIIEIICDQTRGRVPILAGAAEANVRETIAACEHYHELGARAVAIVSPFYYKLSPDWRLRLLQGDRRNSPIDVTLYNIPMFASPIDVPTVQRLAESARASSASRTPRATSPHMMRMIAAVRPLRPDFAFLTGWDAALMPMLLIGCDGGTNATSGVVPEITRKLYDLTIAGRIDEARDAAIPAARAVRRDALLGRVPRRLPRRRRAPRLRLRPRPPADERITAGRLRRTQTRPAMHPPRLRLCRATERRLRTAHGPDANRPRLANHRTSHRTAPQTRRDVKDLAVGVQLTAVGQMQADR